MVFTVLKWLGKIIFPDMWLYEIQILVFINKVLLECSHTHLCTVCDCFCTTVGKLSSCYRNCLFGLLSLYHYIFLFCYQFIPIVSKKVHLEWFAFKAHWSGFDMDYQIKLYSTRLLSCNDTITVLKIYTICWLRTPHNIPNLWESKSGELEILK